MKHAYSNALPKARTEKLIVKELPDEVLVYDQAADQAHCLNHTAARIWKSCDGQRTVSEIHQSLQAQVDSPVDEDLVWLALSQLEQRKLLQTSPRANYGVGASRRQILRVATVAALTLPLITSITVPTAAQAATCIPPLPDDCPCTSSAQCATGCCRNVAGTNICKAGAGGCIP